MLTREFYWKTTDEIKIFAKEWAPEGDPVGVIYLVHGLGEHCSRYHHFAEFFTNHGYAVMAYDRRGHGLSEGKRGHTPDYELLLGEITSLLEELEKKYKGLPKIGYGHSQGGNLILTHYLTRKPEIDLLVTSGAWIKLAFEPSMFMLYLGRLSRKIAPSLTQPNGLKTKHLSRDPKVVEAYENDPAVHNKISSEMGMSMMDAAQWLLDYTGSVEVPLLMMHGTDDQIISAEGSKAFAENATGDIEYKPWEGYYHEIHNDLDYQAVFEYTLNWIKSKSASLA